MRYWIFLVMSISIGLLWLTVDTTEQQQPVMQSSTQTVPQASHHQSPVALASQAQTEKTAVLTAKSNTVTVATFKADAPYLSPEQRSPDNLGGPPSRDMMLASPQEVY